MSFVKLFGTIQKGKHGEQASYDLATDIADQTEAKLMLKKLVEPVFYDAIKFKDNGEIVNYTDCFEISLYRFLHLVFSDGKKMLPDRMKTLMDDSKLCQELLQYFQQYPDVYLKAKNYECQSSFEQRADWCVFLNKRKFFMYKKEKKYEVCASFDNLFAFIKNFFPKVNLKFEKDEQKLASIMEAFSFDYKLTCKLYTTITYDSYYYVETLLKIYINGNNLVEWLIYQYFEVQGYKRWTGHSDYRLSRLVKQLN